MTRKNCQTSPPAAHVSAAGLPPQSFRPDRGWLLLLGLFFAPLPAWTDELSPGFRVPATLLQNVRVMTAPAEFSPPQMVLLREGKIVDVAQQIAPPADAEVLDLHGMSLLPGFIDAATTSLLRSDQTLPEVEPRPIDPSRAALAAMTEDRHSGLTPQFRAHEQLTKDRAVSDRARQAGYVAVHVVPSGRIASGQSAVISLGDRPLRESLLAEAPWSTFRIWERRGNEYPSTMMGIFAHLRQHFLDASHWQRQRELYAAQPVGAPRPVDDPVWEAFQHLRTSTQRAVFEVRTRDDVLRALSFCREHQLAPVVWGWKEGPFELQPLIDAKAAVVLTLDFGDEPKGPQRGTSGDFPQLLEPEPIWAWRKSRWLAQLTLAEQLAEAKIPYAFSTEGLKSPQELLAAVRRLKAAGVSEATILAGLTTEPAQLLGLTQFGQIAPGRPAHLIVLTGPIDHEQTKVRYVFVGERRFEYNQEAKLVETSPSKSAPGVDLSGTWNVTIETGGPIVPATWELSGTPGRIAGRFTSGHGNGQITGGRVNGDTVDVEVSIGAGDAAVVLKFTGTLAQDTITGTLKSPFGPDARFTAKRQAPAAAAAGVVQIGGIETDGDEGPVSAVANTPATPSPPPGRLPLEFPEDRIRRGAPTNGNVFIQNGTVITGTGKTLPGTSLLIREGQIAAIGKKLKPDPGMRVIDATGRYVMPGIIDTHSHIMISNGLGGVNEATQSIVCEVRVNDVINTADPQEYRALAGGATTLRLFHGSANVVGGQDAIVQLKHGATAAEHLLPESPSGVKFALGENVKFRSGRFPNTRLGVEATLQRAFVEALEYRRVWQDWERRTKGDPELKESQVPPRRDLRLEALAEILSQEKFIHSHCYRSDEILMLLRVADQLGIRVRSLQHVLEGYKVAPEIVAHGASCSTFADWWAYKVEAYDAIPHNAALLHAAGANVVMKSDDAELMRHLYQEASKAVRYGNLSPDAALSLVTLNPARELGIDDRLGSLEVGKQGDAGIYNAHPLNTFARCEMTLIAGEPYFVREDQPTAMSEAGLKVSAKPQMLNLVAAERRLPEIDWSAVTGNTFALRGGTLHPVDADLIKNGTLLCDNGRITALGSGVKIPKDWPVIDIRGLHVYPGLIDAGTTVGLTEIGKVVETHDYAESGLFQPDLRAGVAINPDSELIPVARAGGITTALIRPTGGVISGQASIMQLGGWTAPEMVRVLEAGLQIRWPGYQESKAQVEQLREWLKSARIYDAARKAAGETDAAARLIDPRYEALRPYINGERPLFIEAHTQQHISEVLKFAQLEKVKVVLCGGSAAWRLANELKTADIPVIVGPVMRAPVSEFDPFDATYANPGRLHEAGVKFCIRSDNAANSRNAPFEAGMAVAYGLPEEAALRSVTLSAAEILGVAAETGSLAVGKVADLVILDGSPLQVTSQVKGVVIAGQPYRPESRQTRFAEKYQQRIEAK